VAAVLSGFLPKIRFYSIRHKKPAAFYKETEREKKPICNKNKLLMQYTYIMVKKRYVKIRIFYLRPITK